MENFIAYNPTMLHFGKDVTNKLGKTVSVYGKKALLIYGKASVVKNGYYDKILKQLKDSGLEVIEYSGIKSNPVVTDAEEAVKLGIENNIDVIVALGGGSVIDTSKLVSVAIPENLKIWDIVIGKAKPSRSIPVIAILTLAATGTEMNHYAVIQNQETKEKLGSGTPLMYPKHSFLDPQFTYSVPANYTAFGITDIIAHAFESFFGFGDSPLSDRFTASIVIETMKYGTLVLQEPENYDYRANIMWQSTCALNGMTAWGKTGGDWGVHDIGHTLSMLFDTPHGASLSIAYPAWLKLMKDKIPERIQKLGGLIFGVNDIDLFITKLETFFVSIGSPIRLEEANISRDDRIIILDLMNQNEVSGYNYGLQSLDYENLLEFIYKVYHSI